MRIKFLSYNIHKGFNWNNSQLTITNIKNVIQQTHAEIVFLQEVVGTNNELGKKLDGWHNLQYEFLADQKWPEFAYAKNAVYHGRDHGNAILSKYPILKWEQIDISTNNYEKRGVLFCEIELPTGIIHAYCVHLNLLHGGRKKQYQMLSEIMTKRSHSNIPVVIAGDFNDWNQKASNFLEDIEGMHEVHKYLHGSYPKTFPIQYPMLSLDRMYVRHIQPEITRIYHDHIWKELSDHAAIYVEGIIE